MALQATFENATADFELFANQNSHKTTKNHAFLTVFLHLGCKMG